MPTPAQLFLVVCYDIADDGLTSNNRRNKVMKIMEDFGVRVQYSVFECRLTPAQLARLKRRLAPYVRNREDSIRFYTLCAGDINRIDVIGRGRVSRDQAMYYQ